MLHNQVVGNFKKIRINVVLALQFSPVSPLADIGEARQYYGVELQPLDAIKDADAVILAVLHRAYKEFGLAGISGLCNGGNALVIDVKGCFSPDEARKLGITYWRL